MQFIKLLDDNHKGSDFLAPCSDYLILPIIRDLVFLLTQDFIACLQLALSANDLVLHIDLRHCPCECSVCHGTTSLLLSTADVIAGALLGKVPGFVWLLNTSLRHSTLVCSALHSVLYVKNCVVLVLHGWVLCSRV